MSAIIKLHRFLQILINTISDGPLPFDVVAKLRRAQSHVGEYSSEETDAKLRALLDDVMGPTRNVDKDGIRANFAAFGRRHNVDVEHLADVCVHVDTHVMQS